MRQLLNTLYVTSHDSYLNRDGSNIVININGDEVGRIPIHNLQQIICFGRPGASTGAMELCIENNVTLTFLKPSGRYVASIIGPTKGNVLLRRNQYHLADDAEASNRIAKNIIISKLVNCRAVLRKGISNHPELKSDAIPDCISVLTEQIEAAELCRTNEELRGIEGSGAKIYFQSLDKLILKDKENFYMHSRSRRPPRDRFNALLSFTYALLANDVKYALETTGLDPYVGFLHTDRPGRASLALDMMEELRPIADRFVLRLVNLGMIDYRGFEEECGGAFMMTDETRSIVLDEWQKNKSKQIMHPFINEEISLGLLPYVQSMLMARFIRGDLSGYPPYMLKR